MIRTRKDPAAVKLGTKGGRATAARLTPEERSARARRAALARWADPAMRKRMIEAMKRTWSNPKVRPRRIEAMRHALSNPEVRQRRSEAMKRTLRKPEVRRRMSEIMRRPEVLERIRQGVKASWTPEWRAAQSRWSTSMWQERLAAIKAANRRPGDWREKPLPWRVIADILILRDDPMSNRELGHALDTTQLIGCKYARTWTAALSSDTKTRSNTAAALVAKVRMWVNKPGRSHRRRTNQSQLLGAKARLTPAERSAIARRAIQARWAKREKASHEETLT
jgi:hypothetical protein